MEQWKGETPPAPRELHKMARISNTHTCTILRYVSIYPENCKMAHIIKEEKKKKKDKKSYSNSILECKHSFMEKGQRGVLSRIIIMSDGSRSGPPNKRLCQKSILCTSAVQLALLPSPTAFPSLVWQGGNASTSRLLGHHFTLSSVCVSASQRYGKRR